MPPKGGISNCSHACHWRAFGPTLIVAVSMFDFIRKEQLWSALDAGCLNEIGKRSSYELKVVQDVVVYSLLRNSRGLTITEIGGGESRLLRQLSEANQCYNIEKFEGAHGGPKNEVTLPNVQNLKAYVGEWDVALKGDFFDVAFSISVVEACRHGEAGQFSQRSSSYFEGWWHIYSCDRHVY